METGEGFTPRNASRLFKRKKSTPLANIRNPQTFNNTMTEYSTLATKKCQLIDAQVQNILEKTNQQKIEHELQSELIREKIKQQKIEHELRSELLRMQMKNLN